jgi:hypothetical protein
MAATRLSEESSGTSLLHSPSVPETRCRRNERNREKCGVHRSCFRLKPHFRSKVLLFGELVSLKVELVLLF